MSGIIKKISAATNNQTTYKVGLLQAKAYRALKKHTTEALAHLDVSSVEWAFLGILYDNKNGIRSSDAADELGVEAPFITATFGKLEKKDLVETKVDKTDSRAKLLCLTASGRQFVTSTETHVRSKMRPILTGLSAKDVISYLVVLEKIIENSK
jgi:DNA-binding MarR family transcriptional regulator